MTPQEMAEVRPRLLDFAAEMLDGLARKDQRAAGELYVRGLLTDGQRKSMQPMAARLGVDHQRLQQFITSSTWDYVAVRRNVARWFAAGQPVEALVLDDTGFAKDGTASPCVARQYSGTLGKVGNCQVGVSVHLVNEHASCAPDWRLFCPESWDDAELADPAQAARARRRRERADIPDQVRHTEKWRLALEMIDEMTRPRGWGVLAEITPPRAQPPVRGADPAHTAVYGLPTPPPDPPIAELARLAKIRWRVEHASRELKPGLGLDHFEGRSFTGWHRHVTLAALAQAFCTMIRTDPKAPMPGLPSTRPCTSCRSCSPSSSAPAPCAASR